MFLFNYPIDQPVDKFGNQDPTLFLLYCLYYIYIYLSLWIPHLTYWPSAEALHSCTPQVHLPKISGHIRTAVLLLDADESGNIAEGSMWESGVHGVL